MSDKTVLVLGGGVGGLVASNVLKSKLGRRVNVKLVDQKKVFQFPPSYPWLMIGKRRPEQVQKDLGLLRKKDVEVFNSVVLSIDIKRSMVKTDKEDISFDYLIIALGADYAPETIPGFSEHSRHIYNLESALRFKDAIENFEEGVIAIGISRLPYKCPAAPYEVALLLDDYFRKKGVRRKINFEFFSPEGIPLAAVGQDIGRTVLEFLRSKEINIRMPMKITEVRQKELSFENGETLPFNLLFCVPPHRAPQPVVDAGLVDGSGWIPVNPKTLETKHGGVYAVGDVTVLPTPNGYMPFLPKAGVFAHGQAEVVAHNISVEIKGRGKVKEWDGQGSCFLEVGQGKSAFVKGWFLAEPKPEIKFHMPGRVWHMQKFIFEKYWMHHWF